MNETQAPTRLLRVLHRQALTPEITRFTLAAADDTTPLASFDPGAHLTLHLPNGMARKYSLCNVWGDAEDSGAETGTAGCYVIAVKREDHGTGGSLSLTREAQVDDMIDVGEPRNDFPLAKSVQNHLFIAGGIGITPIWSMMQHLKSNPIGLSISQTLMQNPKH